MRKSKDGKMFTLAAAEGKKPILTILKMDEFRNHKSSIPRYQELLHSLGSIRYCKVEMFQDIILGTLRIPQKSEHRQPLLAFGFYMTETELLFIEDTGDLMRWVEKQAEHLTDLDFPDQLLLQIMELMIENDTLYFSHFEKEFEKMEEILSQGIPKDFFTALSRHRQKLSEFNAYYEQLTDMSDLIRSQGSALLAESLEAWDRYALRTERLQNHVHLLQENVLQLRELYQSQQDAQQNKIMCILTVVTTLFLPLTLLTGWYGMNFSYMPELHWQYGYFVIVAVAVIIVILEIIFFKKKKFF